MYNHKHLSLETPSVRETERVCLLESIWYNDAAYEQHHYYLPEHTHREGEIDSESESNSELAVDLHAVFAFRARLASETQKGNVSANVVATVIESLYALQFRPDQESMDRSCASNPVHLHFPDLVSVFDLFIFSFCVYLHLFGIF